MQLIPIRARIRPLRVGWLVRYGSFEDLQMAVALSTRVWGGEFNPIIPVGTGGRLLGPKVDRFGVDFLHPTSPDEALIKVARDYSQRSGLASRSLLQERFAWSQFTIADVSHLLHDETPQRRPASTPWYTFSWHSADPLGHALALIVGSHRLPIEVRPDTEAMYQTSLAPQHIAIPLHGELPAEIGDRATPLSLTVAGLFYPYPMGYPSVSLYVGDHLAFDDLISFWNLRACGLAILFISGIETQRWRRMIDSQIARYVAIRDKDMRARFCVWTAPGRAIPDAIRNALASHDVNECAVPPNTLPDELGRLDSRTSEDDLNLQGILSDQGPDGGQVNVMNFQLPFRCPRADEDVLWHDQEIVVDLHTPPGVMTIDDLAILPPQHRGSDRWYSTAMRLSRGILSGGLYCRTYHTLMSPGIAFKALSFSRIVAQYLSHVGVSIRRSQAGVIARSMVDRLGGLLSAGILRSPAVRALLACFERKAVHSTQFLQMRIQKAPASSDPHANILAGAGLRVAGGMDPSRSILRHLVEHRVLRPRLRLQCPICNARRLVSAQQLRERMQCLICGAEIVLGLDTSLIRNWWYSLDGPFRVRKKQQGSIPVILTLLQLRTMLWASHIWYEYSLEIRGHAGDVMREIDFLLFAVDPWGRPQFVFGECRGAGHDDTFPPRIATLVRLCRKFRRAGFDSFLCYSTLGTNLSQLETETLTRLMKRGIKVIIRTGPELEAVMPQWRLRAPGSGMPDTIGSPVWLSRMAEHSEVRLREGSYLAEGVLSQ